VHRVHVQVDAHSIDEETKVNKKLFDRAKAREQNARPVIRMNRFLRRKKAMPRNLVMETEQLTR
jgi:hypothetical protein